MMEQQIAVAELTLRGLQLRRQLQEVRRQRAIANEEHERHVEQCQERTTKVGIQFHALIHGEDSSSDYIDVVKEIHTRNLGRYVIRKHARLIKLVRSQELLAGYVQIAKEQHDFLIGTLQEAKQNVVEELQAMREEKQARAYLIQEHMVKLVTAKIRAYYNETNKTKKTSLGPSTQGSFLHRLISRKANNRLCLQ
mmetsp:Transcript_25602/g.42574  ORF Transcript_25602/g.42574 Transcript_25602/m.42574 type:complete len:195 (+) Transcript_25602:860-1444(+)|eukprot:CAMPEP_0119010300 /NCGR_PEP_ID=MMETSP1176-20130426/4923_1 /TAXON_ID=265551 /ORGANISM="Synedropsis recta cf, Strain CCMP1620" /LENGTH=194 /DNA_ID=CAMNT_0006962937 /DNA_START=77 /DNA_END=661 /DNA_ORIENTATION=+